MSESKKEKSCGCVIIDEDKVLLIKQTTGHWGFPKGHVEGNETEVETAKREVKEETNLDVEVEENKRFVMNYITDKGISKEVVFFVAKKLGGSLEAQEGEVSAIKWLKFDDAMQQLTFDNTKQLLSSVLKSNI